jgi:hypothetical protein
LDYLKMRLSLCKNILFFGFGFLLAGFSVISFAAGAAYSIPYPAGVDSTGANYTYPATAPAPTSTAISLPATGVTFPDAANQSRYMPVPETAAANMSKYGDAAVPYLFKMGALGKFASLALLICTNTNLCFDSNGNATYAPTATHAACGAYVSSVYYCVDLGLNSLASQSSLSAPCMAASGVFLAYLVTPNYHNLCYYSTPKAVSYPPTNGIKANAQTAADALLTPQQVPALQAAQTASMPVPINFPTPAPSSITESPTVTTQTDSANNPVSQTTSQTTYNSNPVSNSVTNISYTTTSTTTNLTNNTKTTNTTTSAPPAENTKAPPPPEPDPTFDSVDDISLPTQDLTNTLAYTSWGEGTCPADPSASYLGHSIVIPFHVVCNAAGYIRPIVLLLGLLISGYIVSGVRKAT